MKGLGLGLGLAVSGLGLGLELGPYWHILCKPVLLHTIICSCIIGLLSQALLQYYMSTVTLSLAVLLTLLHMTHTINKNTMTKTARMR